VSNAAINIAINGAAGRMGRQLLAAVAESSNATLTGAFDAPGQACIGVDSSLLSGGAVTGVPVQDNVAATLAAFNCVIDFSAPAVSIKLLETLQTGSHRVVIGTTGFTDAQLAVMRAAATRIPIVFAANYSIGITLTLSLLEQAAATLKDDYDIEIIEAHHRHKVDAPSGTALAMGGVIADALDRDLKQCAVYGREGITGERDRQTIGFESIRAGDIIGEHTVLFAGNGERIEITHRATERMTFARGAVRAAVWLADQPPGLYDMRHVLGIISR
jgi:4-hydroxy-tetrahydrodipicolinate reductase